MNEKYSKSEVLLEAIVKILKEDDTNTGNTVREMNNTVADRIYRSHINENLSYPNVVIGVDEYNSNLGLPSGKFTVEIKVSVLQSEPYSFSVLDRIGSRIEFLLNKKTSSINLASSKNLRCRIFNKVSGLVTSDDLIKVNKKTILFDVICDDEILVCT